MKRQRQSSQRRTEYREGWEAYERGDPGDKHPWPIFSVEALAFERGWLDAASTKAPATQRGDE